jgi:hypothetical protein
MYKEWGREWVPPWWWWLPCLGSARNGVTDGE